MRNNRYVDLGYSPTVSVDEREERPFTPHLWFTDTEFEAAINARMEAAAEAAAEEMMTIDEVEDM